MNRLILAPVIAAVLFAGARVALAGAATASTSRSDAAIVSKVEKPRQRGLAEVS